MLVGMLSGFEIAIIIVVLLLLFGPSKLPQLGEGVGKMLRGFKKEMKAIEDDKAADAAGTAAKAIDHDGDEIDVTPKKSEGSSKAKA
ncbi:twin-arginine translocase TatA/TatE family subunit [Paraliomyxa miuraensis]|uniref:twin-arginine translocase TatA/TatE family subunit n=1 Tax=Paraliomyxa miuraensis TaxID=376150 RepID=UPI00224D9A75|nr:twin-arginine translocase TatA/TatE family subunit [Paraliomyxa miuraensis]MCX4243198.1 twin-arginine translocase TatA/TatE family subunit [Paraliomyxa miuraensis]